MSSNGQTRSSGDIAVSVRGLSKSYIIRHNAPRHSTLGDALVSRLRRPFQRSTRETFWALKDVSFNIRKGEVVGVIGRNGAGKSTLLKILSRITPPTTGEVDLYGRVGSLLEVGTGFHQELTGRENIFLNGAILGMTRGEIRSQFDAIVDFAGVEQFLDTPVKRYSSGMYVRLAFAVAAHLRSEILIVDEVLAVGDAEFQRKCLGKMKEVATGGRSVLLVSHNMHSISQMCTRAILLGEGSVRVNGPVADAINKYADSLANQDERRPVHRFGSGEYRFDRFYPDKPAFASGEAKTFSFRIVCSRGDISMMYLAAQIYDDSGLRLLNLDSRLINFWLKDAHSIEGRLAVSHPWLKPGRYRVDAFICTGSGIVDVMEGAAFFEVSGTLPYCGSASLAALELGAVFGDFDWSVANDASIPELVSSKLDLASRPAH